MPKMPQHECAFCPNPASNSGEHIWSAWMGKLYGKSRYIVTRKGAEHLPIKSWETSGLDLTAKVVCKTCNNGWMSKLEQNEAIPAMRDLILSSKPIKLDERQLTSIAAFAFKTAVIADYMAIKELPFFNRPQRRRFAKSLRIPGGVHIWLAYFDRNHGGIIRTSHVRPQIPTINNFNLFVLTYRIGHLVFQVVGAKWMQKSNSKKRLPFPRLVQNELSDRISIPFWPNLSPIAWPPTEHLGTDIIKGFCDRWGNLNVALPDSL